MLKSDDLFLFVFREDLAALEEDYVEVMIIKGPPCCQKEKKRGGGGFSGANCYLYHTDKGHRINIIEVNIEP